MSSQQIQMGVFGVTLTLDADGHLSVFVASTDGSLPIDITDDIGRDNEVSLRVTTQAIEQQSIRAQEVQ